MLEWPTFNTNQISYLRHCITFYPLPFCLVNLLCLCYIHCMKMSLTKTELDRYFKNEVAQIDAKLGEGANYWVEVAVTVGAITAAEFLNPEPTEDLFNPDSYVFDRLRGRKGRRSSVAKNQLSEVQRGYLLSKLEADYNERTLKAAEEKKRFDSLAPEEREGELRDLLKDLGPGFAGFFFEYTSPQKGEK